ncbi:MAG TPA: hypothetical protein VEG34_05510 [Thermoanaerobaculia bacterium]|nr:hypothetical protein [Thermoanaerobaculia bacterium]
MRRQVKGAAEDVTREAREVGRNVRDEAASLAGAAKDELKSQAEAGKDQIADKLASVAERLHGTADDLRGDQAWIANMLDEGVRQLGGLADGLKSRDLGSLMGAVETFARRQPALFAGASVALGFAAARLAKASAERGRGMGDYTGRAETGFAGGGYDSSYPRPGTGAPGGSGMGAHGIAAGGATGSDALSGAGGRDFATTGGAASRDFATSGSYAGARAPHSLHEDQPGPAGLDRAVTSERWRSADLPIGDPARETTTTGPSTGTGTGTGVTP